MQQAIHATQHSALALELTSNALSDAADSQKSELISLLSDLVKDSENEATEETAEDPLFNKTEIRDVELSKVAVYVTRLVKFVCRLCLRRQMAVL